MGTRKRLSKKQLKHDALLEGASNTTKFIEEHLNKLLIVVAVVVVVIVAWNFIGRSKRATENQASAALTTATQTLGAGLFTQAAEQLELVVAEYPGTRSAGAAICHLGTIHFHDGRHEEALARFDEYLNLYGRSGALGTTALEGRAAVLEQRRDFTEAAAAYEDLAERSADNPGAFTRYMMAAVRAYRSEPDWGAARAAAQQVIDKHPDSYLAAQARMSIAEAEARLAG